MLDMLGDGPSNNIVMTLRNAKRKREEGDESDCKLDLDINNVFSILDDKIKEQIKNQKENMNEILDNIDQSLKKASSQGKGSCHSICKGWGRGQRDGGLHWGTYKATVSRQGVFRINMNEELARPMISAITVIWEQQLVNATKKTLEKQIEDQGKMFKELDEEAQTLAAELNLKKEGEAMKTRNSEDIRDQLELILQNSLSTFEKNQRLESRKIEEVVKDAMEST